MAERTSELNKTNGELLDEIDSRKLMEETLRESEKKYRTLFEESLDGIYITTGDGVLVDANESMLNMFGYNREIIGTNILEVYFDPSDRDRFRHAIEKSGSVKDYPLKLRKKDGTEVDCIISSVVQRANDGTTFKIYLPTVESKKDLIFEILDEKSDSI